MNVVVTGGAGFIGSCVVKTLNDMGIEDIIIVDNIAETDKWKNMRNKKYLRYIHKSKFLDELPRMNDIETIIHMGAQSSTTEKDFDYLCQNNFEYTKSLWEYSAEHNARFIYASSAATYGDGSCGFDDETDIGLLSPLNGYGYSKQMFDLWVKNQASKFPVQYVGLKFFNVYGPNEYYKGDMASMVFHGYNQIKEHGKIQLFKSYHPDYDDGGQLRDFVYVKDVCAVIKWFFIHKNVNGLFNVGTGKAQSFKELADAVFHALGRESVIEYIDMPDYLRMKYQYCTHANISKLRNAGYTNSFLNVEHGVDDYVREYLDKQYSTY